MLYHDFQGLKLSALGFGTMRLPVLEDGSVNEPLAAEGEGLAVAAALAMGIGIQNFP